MAPEDDGAGGGHNGTVSDQQQPSAQSATAGATEGVESRFPSTGDAQVDQVIAGLPDPAAHPRVADATPGGADPGGGPSDEAGRVGGNLPDPGRLDAHITDVAAVHRQLQQRLSDLSG